MLNRFLNEPNWLSATLSSIPVVMIDLSMDATSPSESLISACAAVNSVLAAEAFSVTTSSSRFATLTFSCDAAIF